MNFEMCFCFGKTKYRVLSSLRTWVSDPYLWLLWADYTILTVRTNNSPAARARNSSPQTRQNAILVEPTRWRVNKRDTTPYLDINPPKTEFFAEKIISKWRNKVGGSCVTLFFGSVITWQFWWNCIPIILVMKIRISLSNYIFWFPPKEIVIVN